MKCIVLYEFYGGLVLDVVKCTIKIYALTIFRLISISQEKKANVTILLLPECSNKIEMLPGIQHTILLLIELEQRILETLTGNEDLV